MVAPLTLIVMGVAGAGKTTLGRALAARLGLGFEDADDYHPAQNLAKMARGEPLSDRDREPWLACLCGVIETHAELQGLVLACSALKARYRETLASVNTPIHFVYLWGSYELFFERLARRAGHFMGPEMLASQFTALEAPTDAILVDARCTTAEQVASVLASLGLPT